MKHVTNFLSAYEMPRPVQLRQNLFAAFFPLMKLLPRVSCWIAPSTRAC